MAVTSFLSIGMVLVIVTGGIDLSVGKLAGFVSVVCAYLQFYVWFQLLPGQVVLPAILSVLGQDVGKGQREKVVEPWNNAPFTAHVDQNTQ